MNNLSTASSISVGNDNNIITNALNRNNNSTLQGTLSSGGNNNNINANNLNINNNSTVQSTSSLGGNDINVNTSGLDRNTLLSLLINSCLNTFATYYYKFTFLHSTTFSTLEYSNKPNSKPKYHVKIDAKSITVE